MVRLQYNRLTTLHHSLGLTLYSISDFLDVLPESIESKLNPSKSALLECCVAFGRSNYDLNTSLTATGMLWTIADQDSTHASLNVSEVFLYISYRFDFILKTKCFVQFTNDLSTLNDEERSLQTCNALLR